MTARTQQPTRDSDWGASRGARTARGEERRQALIDAATTVFRRRSFDEVRVAEIAEEAGASYGTFYKYFPTKEAVFAALVEQLREELVGRRESEWDDTRPASLLVRIERGNRRFLDVFKRNAKLMVALDYATSLEPELIELQTDFRRSSVGRIERTISGWRDEGLIDERIDPHYAAHALGGMVSRFAYLTYVFEEPFDEEQTVQQLTLLWANSLGLRPTDADAPPARQRSRRPRTDDQPEGN